MGNRYVVKFENFTPAALTNPTIISGTNRRLRIIAVECAGGGSSSAAQSIVMSRSATGTTPAGGVTPTPHPHTDVPAALFTTALTWATAPAGATNGIAMGFNALGGAFPWRATQLNPGPEVRNGEVVVFKPAAGITPQPMSISITVEED